MLHRSADGAATCGLSAKEFHRLGFNELQLNQLVESFLDFSDQRAACHRDNHVVRQTPAKLLGDLVAHGLRAFRIIRTEVDVHESPAILVCDLRAEAVYVVVIAVNAHDLRSIDLGAQNFGRLKIGRNENARFEAGASRLRGNRIGQVASG